MDSGGVESLPSSDVIDEDEIHPLQHQYPLISKPPNNNNNNNGPSTTSVHELLECPVCTNSMYPPIHQVVLFSILRMGYSFLSPYFVAFVMFSSLGLSKFASSLY